MVTNLSDCVLLSIRSDHARRIYRREKLAELRKSFSPSARIVFLYETAPIAAVTGIFTVRTARRVPALMAVALAGGRGIDPRRARLYFGNRNSGWVIDVGVAAQFDRPIPLTRLKEIDHYFSVPRAFSYLPRYEGVTQLLLDAVHKVCSKTIALRPMRHESYATLRSLIRREVVGSYEDIDTDFVEQVLQPVAATDRAFSTRKKHVLEVVWGRECVGYTILTEKTYGAWKTGPTIVLPYLRSLGVGRAIRARIEEYCRKRAARRIYCTCSATAPSVVAYLMTSGLQLEARLRRHLARDRDELVLGLQLRSSRVAERRTPRSVTTRGIKAECVLSNDRRFASVVLFFVRNLAHWYFRPHVGLRKAIVKSVRAWEQGENKYSAKGRRVYACFNRAGQVLAVGLVTRKRSDMLKLNYVASVSDSDAHELTIRKILAEERNCRRVYVTIPATESGMIAALDRCGFEIEGVLRDPFGMGVNHATFGFLPNEAS